MANAIALIMYLYLEKPGSRPAFLVLESV